MIAQPVTMAHGQGNAEIRHGQGPCLTCNHEAPIVCHGTQDPDISEDRAHALGRDSGQENAVCITGPITHALNATNNGKGCSEDGTGRRVPTVATPLLEVGARTGASTDDPRAGIGIADPESPMFTLQAGKQHGIQYGMAVRRLTPRETERLQGFPDDHTLIPWRGKPAEQCPDGPRYKAIGNSWAVPVAHWLGERMEVVDQIISAETAS